LLRRNNYTITIDKQNGRTEMNTVIKYKLSETGQLIEDSIIEVDDYDLYKKYWKDIVILPDPNAKTFHVCLNENGQQIESFYSKRG